MTVKAFLDRFHWTTSIERVFCVNEKTYELEEISLTAVLNLWNTCLSVNHPLADKEVAFFGVEDKTLFVYYYAE